MEEGKTVDESSPIIGVITTKTKTTTTAKNDSRSSATKPFDFARVLRSSVVFLTLGFAFLVVFLSSSFWSFSSSFGYSGMENDSNNELRNVLEAASTKEKTVILTTLNDAWAEPNSIFDLFLESFRIGNNTSSLLNHLLIIAVDENAYLRCSKLGFYCYYLKTTQSSKMAAEASFMTPIYLELMWERLACLKTILSLGYNFVFTDTDVMWFRDPFPHFTPEAEFQTSCDYFNGNEFDIGNAPNNGFLFVRSNKRTIRFYDFWVSSRHKYPGMHEQSAFNQIKNDPFVRRLGLKLRFMDTNYFGGFCNPSKDFNKVCTMHANCCVGLDNKIADLNTVLHVWKTYLSSNHTIPQPPNWRVPKLCHL